LLLALMGCSGDSGDTPADEGCGSNQWQSGDECIDFADEVCDDAIDNDGNGSVDCDDAACMGALACPTAYSVSLELQISFAALGTGSDFEALEESPGVMLEGTARVTGTEDGGDWSVDCTGALSAKSYGAGVSADNSGGLSYESDDDSVGTILSWTLSDSDAVAWEEDCIVALPDIKIGLKHESDSIAMQLDGGEWQAGFTGGTREQTSTDSASVTRWENQSLSEPLTWTTVY
jgi:hypothetical protein